MKGIIRGVRRHPIHPKSRIGANRRGMDTLLALQELASKPHIRVGDAAGGFNKLESFLEALPVVPHEVGDHEGGGPRDALAAVDEHAATGLPHLLEVVEDVVEDAGDVLSRAVLQPQRLVHQLPLEVLRAHEPHAVQHVRDPVPPQRLPVPRHGVAAEVHVLRDPRTLLVEERQHVLPQLKSDAAAAAAGGGWRLPLAEVVGSGAGPLVDGDPAGNGERLERGETRAGFLIRMVRRFRVRI